MDSEVYSVTGPLFNLGILPPPSILLVNTFFKIRAMEMVDRRVIFF